MCSLLTMFDPSISGSVASVTISARAPCQYLQHVDAVTRPDPSPVAAPPEAPTARRSWRQGLFAFVGVTGG
jgi:hypothetical protein